jgi:hypothetical protein
MLAAGQADRGDLAAAMATAKNLTGNDEIYFAKHLAEARVHFGKTEDAIEAAVTQSYGELPGATLDALLKEHQLDAAIKLIDRLLQTPEPRGARENSAAEVAAALADAHRIADAERMFTFATQPAAASDPTEDRYLQAQWAIAAAKRRAGQIEAYQAARQPLLDAVSNAADAPSRRNAQLYLFLFDARTANYDAAQATFLQMDRELSRGCSSLLEVWLGSRLYGGLPIPDLPGQRRLVGMMLLGRTAQNGTAVVNVARAYAEQHKFSEWLEFTLSLPSQEARIYAYGAMADALLPKEPKDRTE